MIGLKGGEDIEHEASVVGALLDESPFFGLVACAPHLVDLSGDEGPKERANADVGDKISCGTDFGRVAGVVAVLGIIERRPHEVGEGDVALGTDVCSELSF